jgi:hypothetical protein
MWQLGSKRIIGNLDIESEPIQQAGRDQASL